MNAHVSNIAWTCYFELHRLASIRIFLTSTATATLVSAFVLSRIDYCNSLLFGSIHDVTSNLQRIQNYAAPVTLRLPKSSSITTHLKSLHWLPVKVRNTYKIASLCYHCHSSTAPSYVADMLQKKPSHTRKTRSSSYTMPLPNRPAHIKATLGDQHLHSLPTSITIGNAQIPFKKSVKNLGFTLDCHLAMNAHVSNIARTCYFELRCLASIRRFLTSTATATLVSAFVLSRIDYCNSLLFGSTHDVTSHLQRIQNYAARVILRLPMSSSITIHLKSLH